MNIRRFLLLLMLSAAPAAVAAEQPSGSFIVKSDFGRGAKFTLLCVIDTQAKQIGGVCQGTKSPILTGDGAFDGKVMHFKYFTTYNGSGLQLDYRGRVDADGSVKGLVANRLASGAFSAAPQGSAIGDWTIWSIHETFQAGPTYDVVCAFRLHGAALNGPCVFPDGAPLPVTGAGDDAKVTMAYEAPLNGQSVHVVYDGARRDNGSFSGSVSAGSASGVFTATTAPTR